MQTVRDRNAANPAAGRVEPPLPDAVEEDVRQPRDSDSLLREKQPGSSPQPPSDDKQPRDTDSPMREKQPGSSPQPDSDDKQPRSSDKFMTEKKPGSSA